MKDEGYPIKLEQPSRQKGTTSIHYSDQFVDDQSIRAVSIGDGMKDYKRTLEVNINLPNSLLNTIGGGDNFGKRFCHFFQQVLENGEWRNLEEEENPELQVRIEDLNNDDGGFRVLR